MSTDAKDSPNAKRRKLMDTTTGDVQLHRRTLRFAIGVAARRTFPNLAFSGGHAIGNAYWYNFERTLEAKELAVVEAELNRLIDTDAPITQTTLAFDDAVEYFTKNKMPCSAELLQTRVEAKVPVYQCSGESRLVLTELFSSLGELKKSGFKYDVKPYRGGVIVVYGEYKDETAIADSLADHLLFGKNNTIRSVGGLNAIGNKGGNDRKKFILQAEYRQEQKMAEIANLIHARSQGDVPVRVVCLAGPTSSGKTTFTHKLCQFLQNLGYEGKPLSVDHYYLSLEDQPVFKKTGDRSLVDWDTIDAMDVKLVSQHIQELIQGKTVQTPIFDMKTSTRVGGHPFSLSSNGILVMEGIHALNPDYLQGVDPKNVFKIYISPLTGLQVDDFNALKTTNHRLLRRMTRDFIFRDHSCERTLQMWSKVRRGEHAHIFKHQNNADYVMNSAMEFEIAVLKGLMQPLLYCVPPKSPNFAKARELLTMLSNVSGWPETYIPATSVFREFVGGGFYDAH